MESGWSTVHRRVSERGWSGLCGREVGRAGPAGSPRVVPGLGPARPTALAGEMVVRLLFERQSAGRGPSVGRPEDGED